MKGSFFTVIAVIFFFLSSCQTSNTVCPLITSTPLFLSGSPELIPTPTQNASADLSVTIDGKALQVDRVVSGPLCNDSWSGIVYVGCDVQVYNYDKENPLFLKDCDLKIDPQTVVYVAYHNNTAYYKGCSCHTGAELQP